MPYSKINFQAIKIINFGVNKHKMPKYFAYIVSSLFLFCACNSEPAQKWNELDLLSHGIPFSILAPDSAEVVVTDFGSIVKDVTIKKGKDYSIQIFASDARITDIEKIKSGQLNEVKSNPYYSKIVQDYPEGFIYESKLDSTRTNYGFKYIKLQGNKEYLISNGMIGSFDLDQVKKMYGAITQ